MRTVLWWRVVGLAALLGATSGCASPPTAVDLQPEVSEAMEAALEAVAAPATVTYELRPRCGPTDAVEGMSLHASSRAVAADRDALARIAEALDAEALDVDRDPDSEAGLLTAAPSSGDWTLSVREDGDGRLHVTAAGEVDAQDGHGDVPVLLPCG